MSQTGEILSALRRGEQLTSLDAFRRYDTMRLAARVRDLRDMGYVIDTQVVEKGGKRFAKYALVSGPHA